MQVTDVEFGEGWVEALFLAVALLGLVVAFTGGGC